MTPDERELDELLSLVADNISLEHCHAVDERYRRALTYEEVERPPLVVQAPFGAVMELPEPWNRFHRYSYRDTFEGPVAMLQNMILERVVPGLLCKDDSPLAIRNNHGTIQIASLLGGNWRLHGDDYPWVEPYSSIELVDAVASSQQEADLEGGVMPRSLATLRFYRDKLADHPPCAEAIQISMPDLQGPMDTAEQLCGSRVYYAFADHPDLLRRLLSKISDTMLVAAERFRQYATDRLDPVGNTQHGCAIPGRLLIRNDSSVMLSADTYAEFVRPHDANLLRQVGTGSIHFCGRGQHLVAKLLEIPDLRGLDFGQPHLVDMPTVYSLCKERKVAVTRLTPAREHLISGRARNDFPTGAVFVYDTSSIGDGIEVARAYQAS